MNDVKNQNDNAAGGYASPEKVPPGFLELAKRLQNIKHKDRVIELMCSILIKQGGENIKDSKETVNLLRSKIVELFD